MKLAALLGGCALAACHDGPHVSGRACIVLDLRYPRQCLGGQNVGGLTVDVVGTDLHGVTESDGTFRIDTPTELATATLRVATGRTDRRASLVFVDDVADAEPVVPVITTSVWTSYVTTMGGTDDPARAALHASFDPPGAIIGSATIGGANEVFYNQGEAFVWNVTPPGDQTLAVLALDAEPAPATVSITMVDDTQLTFDAIPLEAGVITWLELGAP